MATTQPFAYNTGTTIPSTTQVGDLVVGLGDLDYSSDYGGVKWWMGPNEDTRYIIGSVRPSGQPVPVGVTGTAQVGFWGSKFKTEESFLNLANYIGGKNGQPPFATVNDATTWLNANGYYTSYDTVTPTPTNNVTPTVTPTPTVTETPTNTPTISLTPTNTPTPSTTPIPITGYGYNLIATPYDFPELGNSIMNNPGDNTSGSTEINLLSTTGRGFYFNSFDSSSADTRNYFSGFTGQSVTITFSQTGNTAIYSGDTNSFKYWESSPTDNGFVFGTGIGTPPTNIPSGTAVLIQSATTNYTIGIPVYVSLVVN